MDETTQSGPVGSGWRTVAGFLVLCFAAYGLSGAMTASSVGGWYQQLVKPGFNPPDWAFAPVWAILFIAMAVAGARTWHAAGPVRGLAMLAFALQLALNLAWTAVFFGLNATGGAVIVNALLLAAIAWCTLLFWRRDRIAGSLMAPYALWTAFALVLSFEIWRLN
jgi:tryptophan-rich sensory protein